MLSTLTRGTQKLSKACHHVRHFKGFGSHSRVLCWKGLFKRWLGWRRKTYFCRSYARLSVLLGGCCDDHVCWTSADQKQTYYSEYTDTRALSFSEEFAAKAVVSFYPFKSLAQTASVEWQLTGVIDPGVPHNVPCGPPSSHQDIFSPPSSASESGDWFFLGLRISESVAVPIPRCGRPQPRQPWWLPCPLSDLGARPRAG